MVSSVASSGPQPAAEPPPSGPGKGYEPRAAVGTAAVSDQEVAAPTTAELLEQLRQDRLWLLRQLDAGHWPEWRLDLAALERELGQLLEQASERLSQD